MYKLLDCIVFIIILAPFCFVFISISIYNNGHTIPIERLYPPVHFPVSRGTPMISPLLEWDHTVDYFVSKFEFQKDYKSGERKFTVAFEDHPYLSGHVIDGKSNR